MLPDEIITESLWPITSQPEVKHAIEHVYHLVSERYSRGEFGDVPELVVLLRVHKAIQKEVIALTNEAFTNLSGEDSHDKT